MVLTGDTNSGRSAPNHQKLYLLSQNRDTEAARSSLAIFHELVKQLFSTDILDADALEDLKTKARAEGRSLKIADLGTGTACWPLEVAEILAAKNIDAQIDGYDITEEKYPLNISEKYENVGLKIWDINEPPTEDMIGQYDYVHMRLFAGVLAIRQVPLVLDHTLKLLKPGGYHDWIDITVSKGKFGVGNPNLEKALNYTAQLFEATGKDSNIPHNLESYMKGTGYNIVKSIYQDMQGSTLEMQQAMTRFSMPGCLDAIRNAMKHDRLKGVIPMADDEEVGKFIIAANEELQNGATSMIPVRRVLGQKLA
ncbi:hypothetical protein TWF694_002072 [Orbilia ellipsospora]|uniref:Methyltransferase domain-containing protein n=1 Tax=Orbilia ellipsospora TaxID=2528407 RepID=A0AAV9X4F7_9PEZI